MSWKLSNYRTGELVEVSSKEETLATLDADGCVDGMPFMTKLVQDSGRRFRVGTVAHEMCDTLPKTGGYCLQAALYFVLTLLFLCGSPPRALADVAFPIKVTDDGRHLQDANGMPF